MILPVGGARSEDAARELYLQMCDSVVQPDSADIIEVAERLNSDVGTGDDGFLAVAVEPDGRGAVVCVREPLLDEALLAVLEATMDRQLAVYDATAHRLYDPRTAIPVRVTVGDGTTLPYLTEGLTRALLDTDDARGAYLIAQLPGRYLHAVRGARGGWDLESRAEGDPESVGGHEAPPDADSRVASVDGVEAAAAAVWQWVRDGDRRSVADWQSVDSAE